MSLEFVGQIRTGISALDSSILDLIFVERAGTTRLYSTSGAMGGIVGWTLSSTGTAQQSASAVLPQMASFKALSQLSISTLNGHDAMFVIGGARQTPIYHELDATGQLASASYSGTLPYDMGRMGAILNLSGNRFVATDQKGGLEILTYDGAGFWREQSVHDSQTNHLASVVRLEQLHHGGKDLTVALDQGENGVTVLDTSTTTIQTVAAFGAQSGLGIMIPTDMAISQIGGRSFITVLSMAGGGGALSVLELTEEGLVPRDHVLDTLHSRFGNGQALASVEHNGRTYLAAGGGDDGLSLFALLPDGSLVHLETVADSLDSGLQDVSAIAMKVFGSTLKIFASGQDEGGLSVFEYGLGSGVTLSDSAVQTGGAGSDWLVGSGGAETLSGGAGNDILYDGGGSDRMTGGAGADLFVLSSDGVVDTITDFEPGTDKLDLSAFSQLYSADSLTVTSTSWGAQVTWREETIDIHSANAQSLSAAQVRQAVVNAPHRILASMRSVFEGSAGNDLRQADWRMAEYWGLAGDDTLIGGGSDDLLVGGEGQDSLQGGRGHDTLDGGDGNDILVASSDADVLIGGTGVDRVSYFEATSNGLRADLQLPSLNSGIAKGDRYSQIEDLRGGGANDILAGDPGANTLWGETGQDLLVGRSGNDLLYGEAGNDTLIGGTGADRLIGGSGADYASYANMTTRIIADLQSPERNTGDARGDTYVEIENLQGGRGRDLLYGDQNANRILGGTGNDLLAGRSGNDALFGQGSNDSMCGGAGADYMDGGAGWDQAVYYDAPSGVVVDMLFANRNTGIAAGDRYASIEHLFGSHHADRLCGDHGSNLIQGSLGNDTMFGRNGNDSMCGGAGADYMDGGGGWDQAVYFDAPSGVVVDMLFANRNTGIAAGDRYANIEHLFGSHHADRLCGNHGSNLIQGGLGNDIMFGRNGNDSMCGGAGADYMDGGGGWDQAVYFDAPSGVVVDMLFANRNTGIAAGDRYANIEHLFGSHHADRLCGDHGSNLIQGGLGNDIMFGRNGNDSMCGGVGADYMDGGGGWDQAVYFDAPSGVVVDMLYANRNTGIAAGDRYANIEHLFGSHHADRLCGNHGSNLIQGGLGNDIMFGRNGNDTLDGGLGADRMDGGGGWDQFVFRSTREIGIRENARDVILGFDRARDVINLAPIDADTTHAGNQAFDFIGSSWFTGHAGQLRYYTWGANAFVLGDVNGDRAADFVLEVHNASSLAHDDFIL